MLRKTLLEDTSPEASYKAECMLSLRKGILIFEEVKLKVIEMDARVVNYRRGKRTEYMNQYILAIDGVSEKGEALKYLGKRVVWKTPSGKEVVGKVVNTHGNGGALLARFDKGLPGQALGSTVSIEG